MAFQFIYVQLVNAKQCLWTIQKPRNTFRLFTEDKNVANLIFYIYQIRKLENYITLKQVNVCIQHILTKPKYLKVIQHNPHNSQNNLVNLD